MDSPITLSAEQVEVEVVDETQATEGEPQGIALPLLAAFADNRLSKEAAEQLVQMAADETVPVGIGQDLLAADRAALYRKAATKKKASSSFAN